MAVLKAKANGIELAYEQIGDAGDPPVLLIMGFGCQMVSWPDGFCEEFADRGFHVTRFDNRDVGLSTHLTEAGTPDIGALLRGEGPRPPYLVEDMADDAAALIETLSMSPAHVVGVSMGGMIAQALAINHPGQVRSLTSIMSTPSMGIGAPTAEAQAALMVPPAKNKEEYVEQSVRTFAVIGSPGFPYDEDLRRSIAAEQYDRDPDPSGNARQMVAIFSSPDRTPGLRLLDVPALVIHGTADPLVQPEAGKATATAIPGAELVLEQGMGHDLPAELWSDIIDHIETLARRADATGDGVDVTSRSRGPR
jgi:pimeloyl-ACP methyl ester carboxylesterase